MLSGSVILEGAIIAAVGVLPALIVLYICLLQCRRYARKAASDHQILLDLQKAQAQSLKVSIGMGQRMLHLEKRVKTLLEQPTAEVMEEPSFSYSQAAQMIRQGADVDTIAATCGISHSEAHLMQRMCAEGLVESD
ncbi:DUF2802 domain-containing protein [Marinagarivorans algicola]|uniref:DUF2802 domain-containing protein n=1 Tax=Marinagarivorans algicola TaxID=1513270 RepID=UPI00138EF690|nr:DUF2802 domain-containing protein [Marinagarivorans algicola]